MSDRGATFFDSLFRTHDYFILGESHGSSQISRLTKALIPIYARHGGNLFGLEIGPYASHILNTGLGRGPAEDLLWQLNADYGIHTDSRPFYPIPFFSSALDAEFLQAAHDHGLTTVGMDQENLFSYLLLIDSLIASVPDRDTDNKRLARALRDTVNTHIQQEIITRNEGTNQRAILPVTFRESAFIQEALPRLAGVNPRTQRIVQSLTTSNAIYYHHATGDWWNSNRLRTENFVANFRSVFLPDGEVSDERLFLKIGGLHAAKGMNDYYRYDIGNVIFEFARLTGRRSLHTIILNRHMVEEDGTVSDLLQDTSSWYASNLAQLLAVGKPDQWTVIDLAKIRKQGLYFKDAHDTVRKYFERYDVFIIPPADREPDPLVLPDGQQLH